MILQYRAGLTTEVMDAKGRFPIKPTILGTHIIPHVYPTTGTIRIEFHKNTLDVVHLGGQIYGFITSPKVATDRRFIFLNKPEGDGLDIDGVKDWYTKAPSAGGYGGNPADIRPCPNIDRRYEGCPNNLDLSLNGINKQFNALFTAQDNLLTPLVNKQEGQQQIIKIQEKIKKCFFTFLLVCSKGAQDSLVHHSLISSFYYPK